MGTKFTTEYSPVLYVRMLLGTIVLLSVAYMYFLSASVMHVVLRTEVEQSVQQLHSEIALLESQYIQAQHRVSERISSLQGYNEVTNKVFIDRRSPSLVLNDSN